MSTVARHTQITCPCHFLIAPLVFSALTLVFCFIGLHLVALLTRATCGLQVCVTVVYIVGYTVRSQAGGADFFHFLTFNLAVFSSTEQRKKYSNSNYIMHETSQYHVEVRPALFMFLRKKEVMIIVVIFSLFMFLKKCLEISKVICQN